MLEDDLTGDLKTIVYVDKNQIGNSDFSIHVRPDVVLFSSWKKNLSGYSELTSLIEKLLDLGCNCFICAGTHSESLHDFIDDVLLSKAVNSDAVTTWHNDDTDDEVAEFCFHAASLQGGDTLVAFLEEGNIQDDNLRFALSRRRKGEEKRSDPIDGEEKGDVA